LAHIVKKMPDLIGLAQAAELTGVSSRTLRRLIAKGELKCYRPGSARAHRVQPADHAAHFERVS
jgi:excisionase family DNA binding protein